MTNKELTEIIESNKLIAEFMGLEYWEIKGELCTYGEWIKKDNTFECVYEGNKPPPYDHDWNWLMGVVEKIENLVDSDNNFTSLPKFIIESGFVRVTACIGYISNKLDLNYTYSDFKGFGGLVRAESNFDTKTKLEATYKAVIEFIKYYNEWKKKNS